MARRAAANIMVGLTEVVNELVSPVEGTMKTTCKNTPQQTNGRTNEQQEGSRNETKNKQSRNLLPSTHAKHTRPYPTQATLAHQSTQHQKRACVRTSVVLFAKPWLRFKHTLFAPRVCVPAFVFVGAVLCVCARNI